MRTFSTRMSQGVWSLTALLVTLLGGFSAQAQADLTRVIVSIENLAPVQGTFQTPFWVAFHNGEFDIYDRDELASKFFPDNPDALERLAEDGITEEIAEAFINQGFGTQEDTLLGPTDGPLAPGDTVTQSFVLDPLSPATHYFSYASMVIPSNDFFVANGDPLAHRVFDDSGQLVATSFFVTGAQVLDAGTEVNDEEPENTAFFGQQAPNTGVDEGGLVVIPEDGNRFKAPGSGGILDSPRFFAADFQAAGYPVVRVGFRAASAITEDLEFSAQLSGAEEVPPVVTEASGSAVYNLSDNGTRLSFSHTFTGLTNVVGAHLHLAPQSENGPVVAFLMEGVDPPGFSSFDTLDGELTSDSLTGPLQGMPLDKLIAEIQAGNIYINIHTNDGVESTNNGPGDFPGGEIRGQLQLSDMQ